MKTLLKSAVAALALVASFASPAIAADKPGTMLVLDASGSMWGQIDGVNKITIAREVVENILSDFPPDQNLGFVTYGHRERGQCSDIQTIIEPAPDTAHEIIKIVNELNPRGMTPMTDAVIAAAEALRHTEQPATVILVSDGIETCNPDPCAAARALEQSGIDFTAHVIGFDVRGDPRLIKQVGHACWKGADTFKAFTGAMQSHGLHLAAGDRRGIVVVDYQGEVYALARVLNCKARDIEKRFYLREDLDGVDQVKADMANQSAGRRSKANLRSS